jgi:hypothetical protein
MQGNMNNTKTNIHKVIKFKWVGLVKRNIKFVYT